MFKINESNIRHIIVKKKLLCLYWNRAIKLFRMNILSLVGWSFLNPHYFGQSMSCLSVKFQIKNKIKIEHVIVNTWIACLWMETILSSDQSGGQYQVLGTMLNNLAIGLSR